MASRAGSRGLRWSTSCVARAQKGKGKCASDAWAAPLTHISQRSTFTHTYAVHPIRHCLYLYCTPSNEIMRTRVRGLASLTHHPVTHRRSTYCKHISLTGLHRLDYGPRPGWTHVGPSSPSSGALELRPAQPQAGGEINQRKKHRITACTLGAGASGRYAPAAGIACACCARKR